MPRKEGKPRKYMSWVITCSNKRFGNTYCLFREILLWRMDTLLIKEARYSEEMTFRSCICFNRYFALPPRWGDLLRRKCSAIIQPPSYVMTLRGIFRQEMLQKKDIVGNGLGKCSGHDDVVLKGFIMEEFSQRRDQKARKGFGGINKIEVWENRAWFLDGGCEAQSNCIIKVFR